MVFSAENMGVRMVGTDVHALGHSDLNGFLFAPVGEESGGMTLTVLSTLARLEIDPWREAGRLATLPTAVAVDDLARVIATTPASHWSLPDAAIIAERLVALLPSRDGESVTSTPSVPDERRRSMGWSIAMLLAAAVLAATFI
ncbi:hypothetical protein [Belnapia moabensis]|uniref:hypothetical protein n=1 Tax=Belnapia moabensis TaxID=365533 RepID=UPI0012ECD772|nr:hypothetical protein [Belnapia moabensis]